MERRYLSINDILEAIGTVCYYNGLEEDLKIILSNLDRCHKFEFDESSLRFIYSICVCLYGDYGTSPRSGWIEDIEHCKMFIKGIIRGIEKCNLKNV